jgi:glycosyltransferase involved in cell wall biosynthesis
MRMRIVVVNNFYPPRPGGSSHLADALAVRYAQAGHQVLVVTAAYKDAPVKEVRDGIDIVRFPSWSIPETRFALNFDIAFAARPTLLPRLFHLLDRFRPDVIHQHGQFFDLTWASGLYARKRGVPALLSVHTRLENPAALYSGALKALDRAIVRPAMAMYRPAIVVMDKWMDRYIRTMYKGAFSDLFDIPVGVDERRIVQGRPERIANELGLLPDTPLIVSVGHIIPLRDRIALVKALPEVLAAVPRAKLVVVGHIYYDLFLKTADELGVLNRIIATGAVPASEVPDYLAGAAVECHEQGYGLGTATLEAMAAGVPVVADAAADNFPGVPLVDGRDVFLAGANGSTLAEALIAALSDPALARRVGERGRELVREHFTLDIVAGQYMKALTTLRGAAR